MATPPPMSQPQEFDNSKIYLWLKGLESKVNNFIKRANQLSKDFKNVSNDFLELRHEQEKINQKMTLIINELKQTAGQDEVATLKRYIEYWNPLNFVTQKDLERAIESKMSEMKTKKH